MMRDTLDDCSEGIRGDSFREGEFGVTVRHRLGADENEVEHGLGEHVHELVPDFAGEGGFGTGAEDEETDWGGIEAKAFDGLAGSCTWWVEGVSEG